MPEITITGITLDIATGRSRRELSWKNKRIKWPSLLSKLSKTHYTAETHGEYMTCDKARQDEIKDIGGFVGGLLTGGRRKADAVAHRSVLTLDLDQATTDTWETFTLCYDCAACVYSTHKHTPEAPRLRLVIPLGRECTPTEYEAIGRRIAGRIGIEEFDNTGFQPHRLMYWPSTSADGEFYFKSQEGAFLDVDKILDTYHDYRDSSEWPVSLKVRDQVRHTISKQGDPLEKRGSVGSFCRVYSVHEAITTFLSDVYEPVQDDPNRYTYVNGSTLGGLIIYDDKFAYSHHGTDPCSGKLCNAFDLCRIHLFGLRDEDAGPGVTGVNLPSYKAMTELAVSDIDVKAMIVNEKLASAQLDFGEPFTLDKDTPGLFEFKGVNFPDLQVNAAGVNSKDLSGISEAAMKELAVLGLPPVPVEKRRKTGDPDMEDWKTSLEIDGKKNIVYTFANLVLILKNDPWLAGRIALNQFSGFVVVLGALPWQPVNTDNPRGRNWNDRDSADLRGYIETCYRIAGVSKIKDAIVSVAYSNTFHPVRNYLTGLEWDGRERIERLLIDYFGAPDTAYIRAVTRKWFTAGVARVMDPGCKMDYTLTLVGAEGIYKSTFFRILAEPWFTDNFSFAMIHSKQAAEQIAGAWIVEIGELSGLRNAELEAVKNWLVRQDDKQRGAYREFPGIAKRQNVFGGSTNNEDFLRGSTGNRRFWVVPTKVSEPIKMINHLGAERSQIWAEAVALYEFGETLYLSPELEAIAKQLQQQHTETDDRTEVIEDFLETLLPSNWETMGRYERRNYLNGDELSGKGTTRRESVTVAEIWVECLGCNFRDMNSFNTKSLHDIMRKMQGWKFVNKRRIKQYGRQRLYQRVETVPTVPTE